MEVLEDGGEPGLREGRGRLRNPRYFVYIFFRSELETGVRQ